MSTVIRKLEFADMFDGINWADGVCSAAAVPKSRKKTSGKDRYFINYYCSWRYKSLQADCCIYVFCFCVAVTVNY
jgi:hypothetical protein